MNFISFAIIALGLLATFDCVQGGFVQKSGIDKTKLIFWKALIPSDFNNSTNEPLDTDEKVTRHLQRNFLKYFEAGKKHTIVDDYQGTGVLDVQTIVSYRTRKEATNSYFITLVIILRLHNKFPTPIEMAIISAIFRQKMTDQAKWQINFKDQEWNELNTFEYTANVFQLDHHSNSCDLVVTIDFDIYKHRLHIQSKK